MNIFELFATIGLKDEGFTVGLENAGLAFAKVNDAANLAETSIADAVNLMINGVAELLPAFSPLASDIITTLADGLITAQPILTEKAPLITSGLVSAIAEAIPRLNQSSEQIVRTLSGGITFYLPMIAAVAADMVNSVISGIGVSVPEISGAGKNVVYGFWEGIQSMGAWINDKTANFFGGIVTGVKSLLGIKSPSRVFAYIGRMSGEGFVQGIESMADMVSGTVSDIFTGFWQDDFNCITADMTPSEGLFNSSPDMYAAQNGASSIIIQNMNVRDDNDIHKIARELYLLQERGRRAGAVFV